jgi:hypothetical protein
LLLIVFGCFFSIASVWADGSLYAPQSVLSEGRWVKIRVSETGVYKLTYAELKKMGFPDPAKVSVHGYGGWILDEDFTGAYIDDVPAVSVWRGDDYLLFYGKGPVKWSARKDSYDNNLFVHENNPYSLYGYYFVTDATATSEMDPVASVEGASLQIGVYDDYMLHEKDEVSVNKSGRELFGEKFESTLTRNFSFQTPGITAEEGWVTLRFISRGSGTVSLSVDDNLLFDNGTIQMEPSSSPYYIYTMGAELYRATRWPGEKKENTKVTVSYNTYNHTNVLLDYIRLQMKRRLQSYGACTLFRSFQSVGNVSRFTVQNATSGMKVFDVTDGLHPALMETALNGSELSFTIPAGDDLREFALVDVSKAIPAPETVGAIAPQNLHALPQTEMVILAPQAFTGEAERLAEKHRSITKLSVTVVTPEQVYNEFSSGTPDATAIRRFMKMFYDRRSSEADAPRFLLLFGDGSYDNRRLTDEWKNTATDNFILTYQTHNSLNELSYVMDDYYGFLADYDASHNSHANIPLLLAIGRFPVRTVVQAKAVVDKVISYMENEDGGRWKNQLCFVADDGNGKEGGEIGPRVHMRDSYLLTQYLEENNPAFISTKLYFDAFKQSNVGGKASYPDIETNIQRQLKEGVLLINYTGHGNQDSWSDEHVLTNTQIQSFTYPHLPLWITATCDFTPFDGTITSAGENVLLSPKSGGIGLFTTTRVAYVGTNYQISRRLIQYLFEKRDGRRRTLGEVIQETKQTFNDLDRVRFVLIGDPAVTLAYPDYQMKITEINGQAVSDTPVSFKALEKITVKGEVYEADNRKATDFNGSLAVTVMDSKQTITTLNNNGYGEYQYDDYPNTLYKGNDAVRDGEFSFTFTVPKDISYSDSFGKLSLYAFDETANIEAQGAFKNFIVGGTASNPEIDAEGPEIRLLYLNDSTFTDGSKVNETPFFVAVVWDKSGVNIGGSSIGHDVTLTIDHDPLRSYNLNTYYETASGEDGAGVIKFLIPSLPAGTHTAEFKVWDVLNYSTTHTFTFEVVDGLKPYLFDLIAAPSPARESVTFRLYHNRPESQMTFNIRVYDMNGQIQWEHEEKGSSDLFKAYSIPWDLTNGSGSRLHPGVYIYRAAIRSNNSSEVTDAKKLIILGR